MESNATTIKPSKWAEHDEVSSEEGSLKDEDIVKPTARVKAREPPSSTASASTSRPSSSQPPAYERRPDRAPPVPPVHDQSGSEGAGMMVMLGNLNFACTDDELYRFFSEEGGCRIASLRLGKGQNSRNNGTAFIELQDQESVGFALSAKGITFQGRSLRVEVSRGGRINDRGDQGGAERGGDRRERDNRYPAAAERDNGIQWDRKERPPAPLPPKESSRPRVPDRSVPAEVPKLEPVVPATRPKLELKPRTVPVDAELPVTKPESIFGTGKPRVEPPKVTEKPTKTPTEEPSSAEPSGATPEETVSEKHADALPVADRKEVTASEEVARQPKKPRDGQGEGRGEGRDRWDRGGGKHEGRGDRHEGRGDRHEGRGDRHEGRGDRHEGRGEADYRSKQHGPPKHDGREGRGEGRGERGRGFEGRGRGRFDVRGDGAGRGRGGRGRGSEKKVDEAPAAAPPTAEEDSAKAARKAPKTDEERFKLAQGRSEEQARSATAMSSQKNTAGSFASLNFDSDSD